MSTHPDGVTWGSPTMAHALKALMISIQSPRRDEGPSLGAWRWTVRQRMAAVRDALLAENGSTSDGWLAARGGTAFRERNTLLERLAELGSRVLQDVDVATVRGEIARLVTDVSHHVQRVNDLAYDEVEMELGGSE